MRLAHEAASIIFALLVSRLECGHWRGSARLSATWFQIDRGRRRLEWWRAGLQMHSPDIPRAQPRGRQPSPRVQRPPPKIARRPPHSRRSAKEASGSDSALPVVEPFSFQTTHLHCRKRASAHQVQTQYSPSLNQFPRKHASAPIHHALRSASAAASLSLRPHRCPCGGIAVPAAAVFPWAAGRARLAGLCPESRDAAGDGGRSRRRSQASLRRWDLRAIPD